MTRLAAALALLPSLLTAQAASGTSIQQGLTLQIDSRALGERRTIDVALPRGYETGGERFPLIVVLDGESQHEVASGIARFYARTSIMPGAIVVGVRNTRRTRDMTPTPMRGFTVPPEASTGGGADRLVSFLGDELIPRLDSMYRTAPLRVLVGHSLGGLFALHTMNSHPALFTGIVAMEPSIWWNDQAEWRAAASALRRPQNQRTRLMLVNAPIIGADTTHWGGQSPMVRQLSVTGETHESMAAAGMLQAFRTLFEDFRPSDWRPGTRPIAMLDRYDSLSARVGYAVPIPVSAYERAIRMAIHARHFDDADRMLPRMEAAAGSSPVLAELRGMLAEERASPVPDEFIPLEIPTRRPGGAAVAAFLGSWRIVGSAQQHEITIRASGDTIVVHSRIQLPDDSWDEHDRQVIQLTEDGTLEWGLAWFRGLAALLVQKASIQPDGTMRVQREPRGWMPRDPQAQESMKRTETFTRTAGGE